MWMLGAQALKARFAARCATRYHESPASTSKTSRSPKESEEPGFLPARMASLLTKFALFGLSEGGHVSSAQRHSHLFALNSEQPPELRFR